MKTKRNGKAALKVITLSIYCLLLIFDVSAQNKETIAIINIDTRNLELDNESMASIMRLELEKINVYEVMDKYDVKDIMESNDISPDTFGKNAVVKAGKLLGADKMLTGSAERFGEKIVIVLRLVDVASARIEKASVMEYLNVQDEIQSMSMISLNELLGLPNDPHLVDILINYNLPIATKNTSANLSGPRMGVTYTGGETGRRLQDSQDVGGFDMFPVSSMFGYQFEKQYLSSGDFQALVEVIPALNGLESGQIIPSLAVLNGFRFNKSGFEFGLGPVLRVAKTAKGYYENGRWFREHEKTAPQGTRIVTRLDKRGAYEPNYGLILAMGKTFHSGYLNVPVNVYVIPKKQGSVIGLTFGFNTTRKPTL